MGAPAGSDWRLIGLESIALGVAQVATAGMPSAMSSIEAIVPDSAVLAIEMPGKTDLMVEDSDFPDITVYQPGQKFIEFSTRDMRPEVFRLAMGGTTTSTLWSAPSAAVICTEKSVRAISKTFTGRKFRVDIVRAAVRGGANLRFSKTESGTVSFTCDVLRPVMGQTDYPIKIARI